MVHRESFTGQQYTSLTYSQFWHPCAQGISIQNRFIPGYKGISTDGVHKTFNSGVFTRRDNTSQAPGGREYDGDSMNSYSPGSFWPSRMGSSDEDSMQAANFFNSATQSNGSYQKVTSWPTGDTNEDVIFNPNRWDIFGWDSANSQWVKEQWYWNYTTEQWAVDPGTVFPGRPVPSSQAPESLGIAEYPYSNLQLQWDDVRPSASVSPIAGVYCTQVMWNGVFVDAVDNTSMFLNTSPQEGNYKTYTLPVDQNGVIDIREAYGEQFRYIQATYPGQLQVSINGQAFTGSTTQSTLGQLKWFNVNSSYDYYGEDILPPGEFDYMWNGKIYVSPIYAGQSAQVSLPIGSWRQNTTDIADFSFDFEEMPSTGLKTTISGDVGTWETADDFEATATAEGWTKLTNGTYDVNHYIDSLGTPFNAYFPNGVPCWGNEGVAARYLVFGSESMAVYSTDKNPINGLDSQLYWYEQSSDFLH